jgi:hypothetical protein
MREPTQIGRKIRHKRLQRKQKGSKRKQKETKGSKTRQKSVAATNKYCQASSVGMQAYPRLNLVGMWNGRLLKVYHFA